MKRRVVFGVIVGILLIAIGAFAYADGKPILDTSGKSTTLEAVLNGKNFIAIYGRTTCNITKPFLSKMTEYASELGKAGIPIIAVMEKNDKCPTAAELKAFAANYPGITFYLDSEGWAFSQFTKWMEIFDPDSFEFYLPLAFFVNPAGEIKDHGLGFNANATRMARNALVLVTGKDLPEPVEIPINEDNFPDEVFRNYVAAYLDQDSNGKLNEDERWYRDAMTLFQDGISSLKGIEYFPGLQSLRCYGNELTEINVSNNTELVILDVGDNKLTTLDVSKNTKLEHLECNGNGLTKLDVRKNTALKKLDCDNNKLTTLDVSGMKNLTELQCSYNSLTSVDAHGAAALESLECNNNAITSINVTGCSALMTLKCMSNQLSSLDLSTNKALNALECLGNEKITELDLTASEYFSGMIRATPRGSWWLNDLGVYDTVTVRAGDYVSYGYSVINSAGETVNFENYYKGKNAILISGSSVRYEHLVSLLHGRRDYMGLLQDNGIGVVVVVNQDGELSNEVAKIRQAEADYSGVTFVLDDRNGSIRLHEWIQESEPGRNSFSLPTVVIRNAKGETLEYSTGAVADPAGLAIRTIEKITGKTVAPQSTEGLVSDPALGWVLKKNGEVVWDYYGLYNDANYGWWLIGGGQLLGNYTGLWNDPNCGWWLIDHGTIAGGYTGLWYDANYGWWLIANGQVCFDYTGLWCDPNCGWWLIDHGTIAWGYTGLWEDPNYGWWLIGGGTICFDYTGLWNDANYGWWLIDRGTVAFDYTGLWYDEQYGPWMILGGSIDWGAL